MLIDVRTKAEYEQGHIEGAILHDVGDMMRGILPSIDKNEQITLYCRTGSRSMLAKNIMERAGFTNVTDGGGMDELIKKFT